MILATREEHLSDLRTSKNSAENVLRAELSDYVSEKLPMFANQLSKGTPTAKSLQDLVNSMVSAQRAVDETKREIETLRAETGVLSRQIYQVVARMTAASLHVFVFVYPR